MKKCIKVALIILVFSSLFGGAYAFEEKDISQRVRDYLFFGSFLVCCVSIITLGIIVIIDDIKNSKLRK